MGTSVPFKRFRVKDKPDPLITPDHRIAQARLAWRIGSLARRGRHRVKAKGQAATRHPVEMIRAIRQMVKVAARAAAIRAEHGATTSITFPLPTSVARTLR